jgi:hypothetical protein
MIVSEFFQEIKRPKYLWLLLLQIYLSTCIGDSQQFRPVASCWPLQLHIGAYCLRCADTAVVWWEPRTPCLQLHRHLILTGCAHTGRDRQWCWELVSASLLWRRMLGMVKRQPGTFCHVGRPQASIDRTTNMSSTGTQRRSSSSASLQLSMLS